MSACDSTSSFFMAVERGPSDSPSPKISVVTPCLVGEIALPRRLAGSVIKRGMAEDDVVIGVRGRGTGGEEERGECE
jgi:hypothetical protein